MIAPSKWPWPVDAEGYILRWDDDAMNWIPTADVLAKLARGRCVCGVACECKPCRAAELLAELNARGPVSS